MFSARTIGRLAACFSAFAITATVGCTKEAAQPATEDLPHDSVVVVQHSPPNADSPQTAPSGGTLPSAFADPSSPTRSEDMTDEQLRAMMQALADSSAYYQMPDQPLEGTFSANFGMGTAETLAYLEQLRPRISSTLLAESYQDLSSLDAILGALSYYKDIEATCPEGQPLSVEQMILLRKCRKQMDSGLRDLYRLLLLFAKEYPTSATPEFRHDANSYWLAADAILGRKINPRFRAELAREQ